MTLNESSKARLLAAILDRQLETGEQALITEARLRQAVSSGPGFTAAESRQLWRSPAARVEYLQIKREQIAAVERRCREFGLTRRLSARAAASAKAEQRYRSEDRSFSVSLLPQADGWRVRLELHKIFRDALDPMSQVRLLDDGGLEWGSGRPDVAGQLEFVWPHEAPPDQRLLQYALRVVF